MTTTNVMINIDDTTTYVALGFDTPAAMSDTLATFMGLAPGTLIPRIHATRFINTYIRERNLKDPAPGQGNHHNVPDAALTELFQLTPDDDLTYFNMQQHLSRHLFKPSEEYLLK